MTREFVLFRLLPFCALCCCALLGVCGVGHPGALLATQSDAIALQRLGALALDGTSPYSQALVREVTRSSPVPVNELFYPPSFIPALLLLTAADESVWRAVLLIVQIACSAYLLSWAAARGASAKLMVGYAPILLYALYQTARFGQITCIILVCALLFWEQYRERKNFWRSALLLCGATMKPSVTLALLGYLLCEKRFRLLGCAAGLHLLLVGLVWVTTGHDPLSMFTGWLGALSSYRGYLHNSPAGSFVYGASTALYHLVGVSSALDLLALPVAYLLWRMRGVFSQAETIALLLATAFVFGTPHAYDFYLLVPALVCLVNRTGKVVGCMVLSTLMLTPQRVMIELGFVEFDSVLRVVVPLVICTLLVATRVEFEPQRGVRVLAWLRKTTQSVYLLIVRGDSVHTSR
jgi:hypothetical protein